MTIRVAFLSPGVERHGGAERCLTGLLDGLDGMDVEPLVIVFGEGDLAGFLRQKGIGVAVVPLAGPRPTARYGGGLGVVTSAAAAAPAVPMAIRRIRAELRRFGPDVVHSNGTRSHLLLPLLRRRGVPSVAMLHDFAVSGTERRMVALALRSVDAVIANSAMVARQYEPTSRSCRVIDNPVEAPAWRDPTAARQRFGVPENAFVVASLAHFHWYKGHRYLIAAMGALEEDSHLLLAGGALYGPPSVEYLEEVTAAAATSPAAGRIHMIGVQDDVSWVYAAADVVAHCSVRPEPFGMVLIEALLTGTPVVSSSAGTPGEMLQDERTALLYEPGSVDQLMHRLRSLHGDPSRREKLARVGREWAAGRFSPDRHARAVLETYESLLATRTHPRRRTSRSEIR